MSQALFERVADGHHTAASAGTEPAERVHPEVVEVMAEKGIDLRGRSPQRLTTNLAQAADVVVTMGCGDACPYIPGKRYLDWDLPDPKGLPVANVRQIRDDIEARVKALLEDIPPQPRVSQLGNAKPAAGWRAVAQRARPAKALPLP
jgi:arsenate reductase